MPRQRGQQRLLGESVVRGLRMEADLAKALRAFAETQAAEHGREPNMAAAARHLIRVGLGQDREHSCRREGYFAGVAEAKKQMGTTLAGLAGASR